MTHEIGRYRRVVWSQIHTLVPTAPACAKCATSIATKRSIRVNVLTPAVAPNTPPNALHSRRAHRRPPSSVLVSNFCQYEERKVNQIKKKFQIVKSIWAHCEVSQETIDTVNQTAIAVRFSYFLIFVIDNAFVCIIAQNERKLIFTFVPTGILRLSAVTRFSQVFLWISRNNGFLHSIASFVEQNKSIKPFFSLFVWLHTTQQSNTSANHNTRPFQPYLQFSVCEL